MNYLIINISFEYFKLISKLRIIVKDLQLFIHNVNLSKEII